jgi:hypothetical protein
MERKTFSGQNYVLMEIANPSTPDENPLLVAADLMISTGGRLMACNTVLISGALGIFATAVGAFLGHFLSKTWQREQWLLDNKRQEYRAVSRSVIGVSKPRLPPRMRPSAFYTTASLSLTRYKRKGFSTNGRRRNYCNTARDRDQH